MTKSTKAAKPFSMFGTTNTLGAVRFHNTNVIASTFVGNARRDGLNQPKFFDAPKAMLPADGAKWLLATHRKAFTKAEIEVIEVVASGETPKRIRGHHNGKSYQGQDQRQAA